MSNPEFGALMQKRSSIISHCFAGLVAGAASEMTIVRGQTMGSVAGRAVAGSHTRAAVPSGCRRGHAPMARRRCAGEHFQRSGPRQMPAVAAAPATTDLPMVSFDVVDIAMTWLGVPADELDAAIATRHMATQKGWRGALPCSFKRTDVEPRWPDVFLDV